MILRTFDEVAEDAELEQCTDLVDFRRQFCPAPPVEDIERVFAAVDAVVEHVCREGRRTNIVDTCIRTPARPHPRTPVRAYGLALALLV